MDLVESDVSTQLEKPEKLSRPSGEFVQQEQTLLLEGLKKDYSRFSSPFGARRYYEVKIEGIDGDERVIIQTSPNREMIDQYLRTDNNMGEGVRSIYTSFLKDPDNIRIVEIQIEKREGRILGTGEIHLRMNGDILVAVGPQKREHLLQSERIESSKRFGDFKATELSKHPEIKLDWPAQWYECALVVSKDSRRRKVGEMIVNIQNEIARIMGAKQRVFWTDSTKNELGPSYYTQLGASFRDYRYNGELRNIPVIDL